MLQGNLAERITRIGTVDSRTTFTRGTLLCCVTGKSAKVDLQFCNCKMRNSSSSLSKGHAQCQSLIIMLLYLGTDNPALWSQTIGRAFTMGIRWYLYIFKLISCIHACALNFHAKDKEAYLWIHDAMRIVNWNGTKTRLLLNYYRTAIAIAVRRNIITDDNITS